MNVFLQFLFTITAFVIAAEGRASGDRVSVAGAGFAWINRAPADLACTQSAIPADRIDSFLCTADPHSRICETRPSTEVATYFSQLGYDESVLRDKMESLHDVLSNEFKKENSAWAGDYFDKSAIYWQRNIYPRANPEKAKAMRATMDDAVSLFIKVVGASGALEQEAKAALQGLLEKCSSDVRLFSEPEGVINGGVFLPDSSVVIKAARNSTGKAINTLKDVDCTLYIAPRAWLDCARGGVLCYKLLFHEFAHMLNSCNFIRHASDAIDPGWLGFMTQPTKRSTEIHAEFTAIGRELSKRVSCLETISSPKSAVPGQCLGAKKQSNELLYRCGVYAAEGYPSQWAEAEADLWAATALATWLQRQYPSDIQGRRAEMRLLFQHWCDAHELKKMAYFKTPEEVARGKAEREKDLDSASTLRKFFRGCEEQPANGLKPGKRWWDSHQKWDVRMNRNFLRNEELRASLGCALSAEVPASCSPVSGLHFVIPQ